MDGANRYVLHFDKCQMPPNNTTWSVSMYDPHGISCRIPSTATLPIASAALTKALTIGPQTVAALARERRG